MVDVPHGGHFFFFHFFFTLSFFLTQGHTRKNHTKFQIKRRQDGDCGCTKPTKQALYNRTQKLEGPISRPSQQFLDFLIWPNPAKPGTGRRKIFRRFPKCIRLPCFESVWGSYGRFTEGLRIRVWKDSELGYGRTSNQGTEGLRIRVWKDAELWYERKMAIKVGRRNPEEKKTKIEHKVTSNNVNA